MSYNLHLPSLVLVWAFIVKFIDTEVTAVLWIRWQWVIWNTQVSVFSSANSGASLLFAWCISVLWFVSFLKDLFIYLRIRLTERGTAQTGPGQKQELYPGFPRRWQESKHMAIFCCFSQIIIRELDQKRNGIRVGHPPSQALALHALPYHKPLDWHFFILYCYYYYCVRNRSLGSYFLVVLW